MAKKPTSSQMWVLRAAREAPVEGGYHMASIIQSFQTGRTTYGHRTSVVDACKGAGWLDSDGMTTPAGRAALQSEEPGR